MNCQRVDALTGCRVSGLLVVRIVGGLAVTLITRSGQGTSVMR